MELIILFLAIELQFFSFLTVGHGLILQLATPVVPTGTQIGYFAYGVVSFGLAFTLVAMVFIPNVYRLFISKIASRYD